MSNGMNPPERYRTCVHSRKKQHAGWYVHPSCPNPACLQTGRNWQLPHPWICLECKSYRKDEAIVKKKGG